ncbi:MAG: undecaprenyldiphospho-muramoylpentapeptide beta-N-acetylglucosaminyltransferase [Firmicutes bacterium HGW-Firmicutes-3]|jgi:UDP-N-acetylglucosamine--N-acetylmuramyl-(pentapeptide) pyrophosphoryl-undecaprenol N-acetylglucosamine transferase|nr:MAG: undecaprenyldiphospho-muramoylpentapeptide beta-N-acetylglucosaminyltransferase [Firmicutes bacterium HGW-Firmicutes-3]
MKKIILTGGGTAGHVMPHLALLPYLREKDYHVDYIGSKDGIEKKLIEKEGLPYYGIASGKLRRYFDFKNFTDLFKIFLGTIQSIFLMYQLKPNLVFSKGGFVTVPVVIAAWLTKVPVVIHESDMTPGLANKIASRFAVKICTTFESTLAHIPASKGVHTGAPIRGELLLGEGHKGHVYTRLDHNKAILMVTGGSLGAQSINDCLRNSLIELTKTFHVVHLCGKGNIDHSYDYLEGYRQYEFVGKHMAELYAMADVVISRAGSNTITELVALKKPHLLIPLPAAQSRGDQLLNADAFEALGYSMVLKQENLTPETLTKSVLYLHQHPHIFSEKMAEYAFADGTKYILNTLESLLQQK